MGYESSRLIEKEDIFMSGKIAVIGSLNMDMVITTPRVPVMGETILGSDFMTTPGGKGANQAVAIARLGGEVSMIGCVGHDYLGKDLLDNLSRNHVATDAIVVRSATSSGIAVIMIKDGDNCIIVDPGANATLTPELINQSEELIKESALIVLQLEIPLKTVEEAMKLAKKHGVKILLNPAPAVQLSDDLLSMVDIFTPNESECEIITGLEIKDIEDAKKAVHYLHHQKGIPQVIITLGERGVVYNNDSVLIHKVPPKVTAVDTTAAGDSFTGAITLALAEGKDIDEAVDFGMLVGALTVTKKGAQTSLPIREEVELFKEQLKI